MTITLQWWAIPLAMVFAGIAAGFLWPNYHCGYFGESWSVPKILFVWSMVTGGIGAFLGGMLVA